MRMTADMARITCPDIERLDYLLPGGIEFGFKALIR